MSGGSSTAGGFVALVVVVASTGCGGHQPPRPSLDADPCRGAVSDPTSLTRVGELGGDYGLVLAARSGAKAGAMAFGELLLIPRDSAGVPFYGGMDVPLADVGAHSPGDPMSLDPRRRG